jgi:NADH dehydrogenase
MMQKPTSIVVLGGGFGGVYAFRHLARLLRGRTDVSLALVHRTNYFLFTPLLHEVATGGLSPHHVTEPLRAVLGCRQGSFVKGEVRMIDLEERTVTTDTTTIPWDYLVVALGSEAHDRGVPGVREHAFMLKDLPDAVRLKNHLIDTVERAMRETDPDVRKRLLSFVVVGGGPTGVELMLEMVEFMRTTYGMYVAPTFLSQMTFTLVHAGKTILPAFSPFLQRRAFRSLMRHGVSLLLTTRVLSVSADGVHTDTAGDLGAGTVVWVSGVSPAEMHVAGGSFTLSPEKRVVVSDALTSVDQPRVFVLGDMAEGFPQKAQVAVQQARTVAENIVRDMQGLPMRPFRYRSLGDLVSLGRWSAAGYAGPIPLWGPFAWWVWRTVYLFKLLSWRKMFLVAVDWTLNLIAPRDIAEL